MTSVLAVDDSPSLRQMLAATLRAAGCHVIEAADGNEALARLADSDVDVVITDQNMPGLDGLSLTRAVRADPAHSKMPVLILTTEEDERVKLAARQAGATGWLHKPFDPERLVQVVHKVAGQTTGT